MELHSTMNKATQLVHGQAKELAPVDTGQLAGSIHMQVKDTGKELQGRVYTNNEYAMYVEFGTGATGNGSYPYEIDGLSLEYRQDWVGMKAQPYMYPALKTHEKTIRRLLREGVHTTLKQNCKGD